MLTPAWGLFTYAGELVATFRHPTEQGAAEAFEKAGMYGDFIRQMIEVEPGVTQVPLWIRMLREKN